MPYKYPIFKDENSGHLTNLGGGKWRNFSPFCNEKLQSHLLILLQRKNSDKNDDIMIQMKYEGNSKSKGNFQITR